MANDNHIALLKKGVAAWNAWHDENCDIRPNLRGSLLKGRAPDRYALCFSPPSQKYRSKF
jgi:hypothetical protein